MERITLLGLCMMLCLVPSSFALNTWTDSEFNLTGINSVITIGTDCLWKATELKYDATDGWLWFDNLTVNHSNRDTDASITANFTTPGVSYTCPDMFNSIATAGGSSSSGGGGGSAGGITVTGGTGCSLILDKSEVIVVGDNSVKFTIKNSGTTGVATQITDSKGFKIENSPGLIQPGYEHTYKVSRGDVIQDGTKETITIDNEPCDDMQIDVGYVDESKDGTLTVKAKVSRRSVSPGESINFTGRMSNLVTEAEKITVSHYLKHDDAETLIKTETFESFTGTQEYHIPYIIPESVGRFGIFEYVIKAETDNGIDAEDKAAFIVSDLGISYADIKYTMKDNMVIAIVVGVALFMLIVLILLAIFLK